MSAERRGTAAEDVPRPDDGALPPAPRRSLVGRPLLFLAGGETASRVFGFVAMSYLFRALGPASYGHVETAVAVLMFCMIAVELGLPILGTREASRVPDAAPDLVRRVATAQFAAAAAAFALLALCAAALPIDAALARLLVGFGIALFGIPFSLAWVFQARGRMAAAAIPKAIRYAVFLGGVVLFVHGPEDVDRLSASEIAGAAAMALAGVVAFRRGGDTFRIGGAGSFDRRLVGDALPICGSTLVWAVRMYLAVVWVGAVAGPAAAGVFGAAHRIVLAAIGLLDVYFLNLFPQLSVAAAVPGGALRALLARSMKVVLVPVTLCALATPWIATDVMRIVYGPEAAGSGALFATLCWIVPVIAWRAHGRFALIALDHQRWELIYSLVGVALLVALLVPLTRAYGPVGAAWAMLASELAATVLGWTVLVRLMSARAGRTPGTGRS